MVMHHSGEFPQYYAFDADMTIVFTDMRGFTAMSETYKPREVYRTINAILALQTKVIHEFGGSVNKFLGDGVLACFSGEDRCERAFKCMKKLLLKIELLDRNDSYLPCHVGFGINDGHVLFGLLGDDKRREFTVLGDTVNTAARLCGAAEAFKVLMTENFVHSLPDYLCTDDIAFVESRLFRGKRDAVRIYAITAPPLTD